MSIVHIIYVVIVSILLVSRNIKLTCHSSHISAHNPVIIK